MSSQFSRNATLFASLALLLTVLLFPRWERGGTEAPIAWDVSGYYLYLPAVFIYQDLEKLEFLPGIIEKYQPSPLPDQAFPVENGNRVMKYSAGMAVLYLPFFLVAHAVASVTDFPADGFSLPYQIAVQLGGALVGVLGLFFLWKILRRYFPGRTSGWAVLLLALGTNFFNYATFDAGNAHVWLFTLLALTVHFTIRWHERPSWRNALGMGICIGLAALVRPTEVLYALVPLLWGINRWEHLRSKFLLCKKHFPHLLLVATSIVAIGAVQLIYWKTVAGHWIVYSYQDQGFSFLHPHFEDVFFSYRKGWFVYTPLMLFTVAGFLFWVKKWKSIITNHQSPITKSPYLLPVLVFCFVNTWIVASWDIWWYGGAFGQRALIASYVLLAFPLASLLQWAGEKRWPTWALAPLLAGCLALNLFQTYQAHWGPWEADSMNGAYYWRIFANTKNDLPDRLLLDTNEAFLGEKKNGKVVFQSDLSAPQDTIGLGRLHNRTDHWALFVDGQHPFSAPLQFARPAEMEAGKWFTVRAWCLNAEFSPSYWQMPQVVVRFLKNGELVTDKFFRPHRMLWSLNEWQEVEVDLKVPTADFDTVSIFLWNPQNAGSLWVDGVEVEVFF